MNTLQGLEKIIEEHRSEMTVTCDVNCWCWRADSLIAELRTGQLPPELASLRSENARLQKSVEEAREAIEEIDQNGDLTSAGLAWLLVNSKEEI